MSVFKMKAVSKRAGGCVRPDVWKREIRGWKNEREYFHMYIDP